MKLLRLTPIALAAAAFAAHAQESAPAEPVATVVVSASADASAQGLPSAYAGGQVARGGRLGLLGNVDIMDTPFNSMNYTQALIQDQQARSVADVVQNDPSVRSARGFGNYQELYMIRGFPVYSDDMAYNGLYGLLPRQYIASELLERVEVLRGANSFITGAPPSSGGIGGAINLLPKRATNRPLTQVTAGVETGGQAYLATDVSRRFGTEDRLGVRVNAVRRDGDTAVDRESRELSMYAIGMDYRGKGYRLSADVGHQDHQLRGARPSVTVSEPLPIIAAPDSDSNYAQPWTFSGERDTFGTLRAEADLPGGATAWAAIGMRKGVESNIISSPTVIALNGNTTMTRFDNVREDDVRTGEVGVRTELKTGAVSHKLSATAATFHAESKNAYAMSDFAGFPSNLYRPVDVAAPSNAFFTGGRMDNPLLTQKTIASSLAIADTMGFLDDRFLVTVGARYQKLKDYGYDYGTGAPNAAYEEGELTPAAGIVYKPAKGVSVYANYAEALQKGPVANGVNIINQGEIFPPYVSRQKEAGVKYDGGKLGMSAAVFTTSRPSGAVVGNRFGIYGAQRNRGVELNVFGMPMQGLRLLGGLTLLDAEELATGQDVIGVPKTQLNMGANWDVPGVQGLSLNARALYTSKVYANEANTQRLPSWTRFDVGANYTLRVMDRDVTLRARIENLTDKSYWASAGGYPGYGYLVQGNPRSVAVSATVDF
ncbi:TonB-dependent siderophore receptor [Massilia sp. IC2-476]|uniref:TonB-dependent receptor n=1 Tax=Massilia sp. IC2-476 TaxID=2887199 RepID=UPI001D11490B|nr:TonB-dependent receptor [Massilia sp. IC2-476]MCC2973944.1 TonB-dependent receptor [Massilia sp. IC2-476]